MQRSMLKCQNVACMNAFERKRLATLPDFYHDCRCGLGQKTKRGSVLERATVGLTWQMSSILSLVSSPPLFGFGRNCRHQLFNCYSCQCYCSLSAARIAASRLHFPSDKARGSGTLGFTPVKSAALCAHQLRHMGSLAAVCAWCSQAWLQQRRWLWCSEGSPAHDTRGFIYIAALSLEAKKKKEGAL